MHVRMMCLGRHWNGKTYRYEATRTDYDDRPVPPIPESLARLARSLARHAGMTIEPDICIVNHYGPAGRMGLHQDKDESAASIAAGIPIVSVSLGDTGRFLLGGTRRRDPVASILLRVRRRLRVRRPGTSALSRAVADSGRNVARVAVPAGPLEPDVPAILTDAMPIVPLETLDDPRVAVYGSMRDPELVKARGLFIAEGRLVVERLIATGAYDVQSLLLSDTACTAMQTSLRRLPAGVPVFTCRVEQFAGITGLNIHRGCLALVTRPMPVSLVTVAECARTLVVLENVSNPDNVGGIFRNAAAFGADAVVLGPGCCDPFYRKAIRTSMAATLRVPFVEMDEWPAGLQWLRSQGFQVVALTPGAPSITLEAFAQIGRPARLALLFGAEGDGLSHEAREAARRACGSRLHPTSTRSTWPWRQGSCCPGWPVPSTRGWRGGRPAGILADQLRRRCPLSQPQLYPSNTRPSARSANATSSTTGSITGRSGSSCSSSRRAR